MSKPEEIVVTRPQLYELVWSKPMRILAKEFGISDVALGKWCRKMEIPSPGVGYWQKLEAGKKVTKPKLPDPTREDDLIIRKDLMEEHAARPVEPAELPDYEIFEARPENKIAVPERLRRPHPLVELSGRALRSGWVDHRYGWMISRDPNCMDIRVTPDTLTQALLLVDTIIKALHSRQIRVETHDRKDRKGNTFALVDDESILFDIFEAPRKGPREDHWSGKTVEGMVPSGKLVLRVHGEFGIARELRDQKRKTLNDRLNEFVVELHREAQRRKANRIEREREELERQERRRRQLESERQHEEEAARIRQLEIHVANWRKANDIREFLKSFVETYERTKDFQSDRPIQEWIEWASAQADRMDPLVGDRLSDVASYCGADRSGPSIDPARHW